MNMDFFSEMPMRYMIRNGYESETHEHTEKPPKIVREMLLLIVDFGGTPKSALVN